MNEPHLHWREWVPEFLLLALLWGSSFLFMREGAYAFGPFPTAWVRITLAAVMASDAQMEAMHRGLEAAWDSLKADGWAV